MIKNLASKNFGKFNYSGEVYIIANVKRDRMKAYLANEANNLSAGGRFSCKSWLSMSKTSSLSRTSRLHIFRLNCVTTHSSPLERISSYCNIYLNHIHFFSHKIFAVWYANFFWRYLPVIICIYSYKDILIICIYSLNH